MTDLYAYAGTAMLAVLTIFQLALMLGAPLGKYAWGGSHAILPTRLRTASAFSILIYVFFAVILLDKADIISIIQSDNFTNAAIWTITGYLILGVLMNALSRSKLERSVMTPTALLLAVIFLLVAQS